MNKIQNNMVVLISQLPGGGTINDFLKELSPEKRCKYNYIPFYANTSTEAWVDKLKCKLKQLYKKNCKKSYVLSTLFDTNLEMLLARVQEYVCSFYLTHSTYEVNSIYKCFKTLPAGNLLLRTNEIYQNDGTFKKLAISEISAKMDNNYNKSVLNSMSTGRNIVLITTTNIPKGNNGDTLIVSASQSSWVNYGKSFNEVNNAVSITSQALADYLKEVQFNTAILKYASAFNTWALQVNVNGPKYVRIYTPSNNEEESLNTIVQLAGAYVAPEIVDGVRIFLNQSNSSGISYNNI